MTMMMTRSLLLLVCVAFLVSCSSQPAPKPDRGLTGGTLVFSDDFEREEIGDDWLQRSGKWRIVDGALHVQGDRNEGIWLSKTYPIGCVLNLTLGLKARMRPEI